MLSGLLLALTVTLIPLALTPEHISPLVPAQHFQPVTVPFEYFNRHIFITLSLNGEPGMVFLLDSGADKNILNLRTSESMGLKPVNIKQAKGLGLGSGKIHVAAAKNIDARIGGIQVANVMAIVDLQGLEQHFDHREDGILGFPFLQQFVVVLDFDTRMLTLLPAKTFHYRGPGDTVSLLERSKSALIPVLLGTVGHSGCHTNVEIDTGSDATLLLYPRYVRRAKLDGIFLAKPTWQGYGLGGYFLLEVGPLQSLLIGPIEARPLSIFRMQSDPVFVVQKGVAGVIGNSLLDRFQRVLFDVPGGKVIFELKPPGQESANPPHDGGFDRTGYRH